MAPIAAWEVILLYPQSGGPTRIRRRGDKEGTVQRIAGKTKQARQADPGEAPEGQEPKAADVAPAEAPAAPKPKQKDKQKDKQKGKKPAEGKPAAPAEPEGPPPEPAPPP